MGLEIEYGKVLESLLGLREPDVVSQEEMAKVSQCRTLGRVFGVFGFSDRDSMGFVSTMYIGIHLQCVCSITCHLS